MTSWRIPRRDSSNSVYRFKKSGALESLSYALQISCSWSRSSIEGFFLNILKNFQNSWMIPRRNYWKITLTPGKITNYERIPTNNSWRFYRRKCCRIPRKMKTCGRFPELTLQGTSEGFLDGTSGGFPGESPKDSQKKLLEHSWRELLEDSQHEGYTSREFLKEHIW